MIHEILNDMSLESLDYFLNVCSDDDWKKQQRLRAFILLKFIEDNNLLASESKLSTKTFDDAFELFQHDLTDVGHQWYEEAVCQWDDLQDEGQPADNIDILTSSLNKMRENA